MTTLDDIRAAHDRIRSRVHRTPLLSSATLATSAGVARVALKCENLQKAGSFKARGALNALSQLDAGAQARGVVSFSAGNHAQALAWGARTAGVKCTVVMPATASQTKVAATRGYGAEVILHGTGTEALAKAHEMSEQQGLTLVHPFDDDRIIAGTGTVALEILDEWKGAPDVVVVPIGGGGLISGIALAIKERAPATRVIGGEPTRAAVMRQSLDAGHPTSMKSTNTIADGLAAPMAGVRNFEIVKRYVDDVVLVSDDEIAEAMRMLLLRGKLLAEPAGAAAAAALVTGKFPTRSSESVVLLVSGGNVDTERIKSLI